MGRLGLQLFAMQHVGALGDLQTTLRDLRTMAHGNEAGIPAPRNEDPA